MDTLEFLLEEPSMAVIVRSILPAILPPQWQLDRNCFVRVHQGKQDLQRSLPIKIRAARNKNSHTTFVVVQDQDASDCRLLKKHLADICEEARGNATNVSWLIRIVCHELEAWYLGDLNAVSAAFPSFNPKLMGARRLNDPDSYVNPKHELKRHLGDYPQIETARRIASNMTIEGNKSQSFNCFIEGVRRITNENES